MEIYKKTLYNEYEYFYFDGSESSAFNLKQRFKDCCTSIENDYYYDENWEKTSNEISGISINNSGFMFSNYATVRKGEYLIFSKDAYFFEVKKNLDDYIIDNNHMCRKPVVITLEYERFMGDTVSAKKILYENSNEVSTFMLTPALDSLIITPKYWNDHFENLHLFRGDYLVKTEYKRLFVIHYLEQLEECFNDSRRDV